MGDGRRAVVLCVGWLCHEHSAGTPSRWHFRRGRGGDGGDGHPRMKWSIAQSFLGVGAGLAHCRYGPNGGRRLVPPGPMRLHSCRTRGFLLHRLESLTAERGISRSMIAIFTCLVDLRGGRSDGRRCGVELFVDYRRSLGGYSTAQLCLPWNDRGGYASIAVCIGNISSVGRRGGRYPFGIVSMADIDVPDMAE